MAIVHERGSRQFLSDNKKEMKKFRHIFVELYGFNLYYIKCDRSQYDKRVKYEFNEKAPFKQVSTYGTFEVYTKGAQAIGVLWLSEKAKIDHLLHECFHAVHYFLDDYGFNLSNNSEEAYAYLLQYLFKKTKGVLK